MGNSLRVFISYSHKDSVLKERLLEQLSVVERFHSVDLWTDDQIPPGANWRKEIDKAMATTDVAILLVSASFLSSGFINHTEIPTLLKRHASDGLVVIPVLLSACSWEEHSAIKAFQVLPKGAEPITKYTGHRRNSTLKQVATTIATLAKKRAIGSTSGAGYSLHERVEPEHIAPVDRDIHIPHNNTSVKSGTAPSAQTDAVQSDGIDPVDLVETLEKHLIERERGDADPVKKQTIQKKVDDLAHKLMGKARKSAGDDVAGSILIKPIASGNFATVWLSRNASTGETTAVKLFHAEKLSQGLMLWRFRRSIRAMRLLTQHRDTPRSVVRIREVSTDTLAFAMDYLAGGDLSDIDRRGWSLQQKIDVMLEICRAVAFAHRVGVIHRDIKPSNVIIDDRGGPVLTDFDIADIHFVTKLSVASGGLGTPVFAAPEQLEEADSATERSDIYSLGRLLYFLLLERSPGFQIEEDPALENLRRFPSALVAIVRRATQYRPERRYAGVNEMISELAQYQSRRARAMAQLYLAGRWTKRNAYALMILSLIIGGLLAFVVYYQEQALLSKQRAEAEKKYADEKRIMAENVKQLASRVDGLGQQKEDLFYEINRIVANKNIVTEQLKKADLTEQQRAELEIELSRWVADEGKTRRKLIQLNSEMATTRKQLETIMTTHQIARPGLQSPSPATSVAVDNLQPMPSPTIAPAATATASPVDPLVPMSDDRDFRPSWQ